MGPQSSSKLVAPYGDARLLEQRISKSGVNPLLSLCGLFPPEWREERAPFDEQRSNTSLRAYAKFQALAGWDPLCPSAERRKQFSFFPLDDSISIFPTPLILSRHELDLIRRGTAQQMRALSKFFSELVLTDAPCEMVAGGIVPAGIISIILSNSEFNDLGTLRKLWAGKAEQDVTFLGAGDLVRLWDGRHYTLEFNVGPLGGLGDNGAIHAYFANSLGGEERAALEKLFRLECDDLKEMLRRWASLGSRANALLAAERPSRHATREALLAAIPVLKELDAQSLLPKIDLENWRLHEALLKTGLPLCDLDAALKQASPQNPVAAFDSHCCCNEEFRAGAVFPLNPPGVDELLGDKLLLPYLDLLVRYYCHEAPLLPTVPSRIVSIGGGTQDASFTFGEFPFSPHAQRFAVRHEDRVVFKFHGGAQGEDVFPFTPETFELLSEIFTNVGYEMDYNRSLGTDCHEIYVMQPFINISRLAGHIVDIRPIGVALGGGESYVSRLPWGRAIAPQKHNPEPGRKFDALSSLKLNVSDRAMELVVIEDMDAG